MLTSRAHKQTHAHTQVDELPFRIAAVRFQFDLPANCQSTPGSGKSLSCTRAEIGKNVGSFQRRRLSMIFPLDAFHISLFRSISIDSFISGYGKFLFEFFVWKKFEWNFYEFSGVKMELMLGRKLRTNLIIRRIWGMFCCEKFQYFMFSTLKVTKRLSHHKPPIPTTKLMALSH